MDKNIHEIFLNGNDEFTKNFNECSYLYQESINENNTEEERNEYFEKYYRLRQCMELGIK